MEMVARSWRGHMITLFYSRHFLAASLSSPIGLLTTPELLIPEREFLATRPA
jgi:hypothetical protein